MSPSKNTGISPEWINGRQACQMLDCSPSALQRAALLGHIAVRLEPGIPPRYLHADVERHAGVKEAKAPRRKTKPRRSRKTGEVVSDMRAATRITDRTNETL